MNKLIQDIGFVQHIQKPKNGRKIPVKVYEEIKWHYDPDFMKNLPSVRKIEWVDNNGINTPYLVTVI